MKALAAEEAIHRAKQALSDVQSTKRQMIAETIEAAEREAVAETEQTIKAECEDYKERVILPTDSEIETERWETLRMEGRAILTRRVIQGWQLLPVACKGSECFMTPLVGLGGRKECCVCGGSGSGTDGAYAKEEEVQAAPEPSVKPHKSATALLSIKPNKAEHSGGEYEVEEWVKCEEDEDFEMKRAFYSKEIGKRMLLGWTLIDASCPKCSMPLMMDDLGNTDLCIAHGEVKPFDGSTIATKEMAVLETVDTEDHGVEDVAVEETSEEVEEPKKPIEAEYSAPDIKRADSDLCSTIQKQAKRQQEKKEPVVSSDPPALKTEANVVVKVEENTKQTEKKEEITKNVIPLPTADFADSAAIQKLVGDEGRDDTRPVDISIEMIANMFLKSPHGYDFQNFAKFMNVDEVKELVDIFLVTDVDSQVSDDFKISVAERIITKMDLLATKTREERISPLHADVSRESEKRFSFSEVNDDNHTSTRSTGKSGKRPKPRPEDRGLPPKSPGPRTTPSRKSTIIEGGPTGGNFRRSRSDDMSAVSRASSVASDALESIYDRIEACKQKLLDPNNSIDEQIATASLLERLAQAAVAVKEMEDFE
eukprot:jgi/Psemu1/304464/fgenesh1_kg.153_\